MSFLLSLRLLNKFIRSSISISTNSGSGSPYSFISRNSLGTLVPFPCSAGTKETFRGWCNDIERKMDFCSSYIFTFTNSIPSFLPRFRLYFLLSGLFQCSCTPRFVTFFPFPFLYMFPEGAFFTSAASCR